MLNSLQTKKPIEVIGHRGCRGVMPENTIAGFIEAIKQGVDSIELDVVITKDKKVVVSHEPWMNADFCLDAIGNKIALSLEKPFPIFEMDYEEVKKFDCGMKVHPAFAHQKKLPAIKPLLADAIHAVRDFCMQQKYSEPHYHIEIKSVPADYGIYQPQPNEFCDLVMEVVQKLLKPQQYTLLSFDFDVLRHLKHHYPTAALSTLTETEPDVKKNFKQLGFITQVFSPYYGFVTPEMVLFCAENKIRLVAWTVNSKQQIKKIINLGVDGIVTDYPAVLTGKG